jgi:hypothetical protein
MKEQIHEHLIGELRQNTRTDTIFVITALLLNLVILAVNSGIVGEGGERYDPTPYLVAGSHRLHVEIRDDRRQWRPAGAISVELAKDPAPGSAPALKLPDGSRDIRFQLGGPSDDGWATATDRTRQSATSTLLMYVFIILQIFVNGAVIIGLLRGKRMRLVILDGLLRMYRDEGVEGYYDESLFRGYTVRYRIFISVVISLGVISILVPLILRYS